MNVRLEPGIDGQKISDLIIRLESESFSEGCYVSAIRPTDAAAEAQLYIRLPNAKHGVVVPVAGLTPELISWAIEALGSSIEMQ